MAPRLVDIRKGDETVDNDASSVKDEVVKELCEPSLIEDDVIRERRSQGSARAIGEVTIVQEGEKTGILQTNKGVEQVVTLHVDVQGEIEVLLAREDLTAFLRDTGETAHECLPGRWVSLFEERTLEGDIGDELVKIHDTLASHVVDETDLDVFTDAVLVGCDFIDQLFQTGFV